MIPSIYWLLMQAGQIQVAPAPPEESFMWTESGLDMEIELNTDLMLTE